MTKCLDNFYISATVEVCPAQERRKLLRKSPSTPICSRQWERSRAYGLCSSFCRPTRRASWWAKSRANWAFQAPLFRTIWKSSRTRIWSKFGGRVRSSGTRPTPRLLRNCSAFYTPSAARVTKPSNLRRLSRSADRRHLPHDQVQGASLFREFVPYANGRGLSTRLNGRFASRLSAPGGANLSVSGSPMWNALVRFFQEPCGGSSGTLKTPLLR